MFSNLPKWLIQGLPIATLLALLFSLGELSKKNEITAIKSLGINMWRIITLFITMGIVIGIFDFMARELVVSKTSVYSEMIKKERIQKKKILTQTYLNNQIFTLSNNMRMTIRYLNTKTNTMNGVTIEKYNTRFEITHLILAEKACWENGSWILKNGVIRDFSSIHWNEFYFKDYNFNINISPENLIVKHTCYNTMNFSTLKKHINQLKTLGQTTTKARIVLNTRCSDAFSHIIVMMIGIPFAIGFMKKLNKIISFTLALGITFVYWGTQATTRSLGENFILSPFVAAWLPNILFLIISIYLLIKIKK
jgi:lipopolysaccharide export system permease protein